VGTDITVRPPWIAVGLLSGVGLGYEILLTRLLSLVHWHHLVPLVISLALLGYGASGTLLTLFRRFLLPRFAGVFTVSAILFALAAPLAFVAVRNVPFNPEAIPFAPGQLGWLMVIYLLLALPFLCLATGIGLALTRFARQVHAVYAVDLLGAGLGAIGVTLALHLVHPERLLLGVGMLGLAAALVALIELRRVRSLQLISVVGAGLFLLAMQGAGWLAAPAAEYKDLHRALQATGAGVEAEATGPLGVVAVLRNDHIPLRFAPGLSLRAAGGPPEQRGIFVDGDLAGAITRFDGVDPPGYLNGLISWLPYQMLAQPRVLVLGAGGGSAVLQALAAEAASVDAVEQNARLIELMRGRYLEFTGALYDRADTRLFLDHPRRFLEGHGEAYDLIVLDLVDTQDASATGLLAQRVTYLYTVEAIRSMLDRLRPGGLISITRWLQLPPRDMLRLVATTVAALEAGGISDAGRHLAVIRGWNATTLVASPDPLTDRAVARLRDFAGSHSFDLVYHPGMRRAEANRFNRLDSPLPHDGMVELLGPGRDAFTASYPFHVEPVTDDRPFFFRYSRWRNFHELLLLPGGTGYGQIDWGYWVLVAAAIQALLLGGVFILWPLRFVKSRTESAGDPGRLAWISYFALIGLGYLFIELAYLQQMQRFLGHPVYAAAVVLAGFLTFSGFGSALAGRMPGTRWPPLAVTVSIGVLAVGIMAVSPIVMGWGIGSPAPVRFGLAVALIAPLALVMGMPFPLALRILERQAPPLLPLAWGVNGCASVLSAVTAALLAMAVGFSGVVVCAAALYLLAGMLLSRRVEAMESVLE
jgi:spermidine synthase